MMVDRELAWREFLRKEWWPGLGVFSTACVGSIDKVTGILIAAYRGVAFRDCVVLLAPTPSLIRILVAVVLVLLVPIATLESTRC